MKKAAIVLPTYNESKNIEALIDQIITEAEKIKNWDIYIFVIDSNSPDKTADIVENIKKSNRKKYKNIELLKTGKAGLGKAYLEGFDFAIKKINPFVVFEMDADLSHNPDKIPEFLEEIEKGADFVIGSRYMKGGSIPQNWNFQRKLYSVLGNWIIRLGFMKMKITDWTSGYRAIKTWIIKKNLDNLTDYTGYVFQVAILDDAVKNGANIKEVPIKFVDRVKGESKINSGQYILNTMLYVFTNSSFIKFCIVGGTGFILDFAVAYSLIHFLYLPKVLSNMLSAEAAIISNFIFNNSWSFAHKKIGGANSFVKNLLKFNLVSSGSIIIQGAGMWLALKFFGDHTLHLFGLDLHSWIIYKVIIIAFIVIPYSYIFYNKFIWKDK